MRHVHGGNIYANKCSLDFSSNINPLGMSKEVKEAFIKSLDMCICYSDPECVELRTLLSQKENVGFESIICSNGAAELIYALCTALKPKKALVAAPCFAEYEAALLANDCRVNKYTLKESEGFKFDKGFIDEIDETTDIVFLTNPNNPTGVLTDFEYIEAVAEKCSRQNAAVVFDECFLDFIQNGEKYSAKRLLERYGKIVILKAFTKFYGMPGIRLGYGIFSEANLTLKVRECMQTWNVSVPAQFTGVAALKGKDIAEETLSLIEAERAYLTENMQNLALKVYGGSANFIFFKEDKDFGKEMLKRGILVRGCGNYYSLDDTYYRIAVKRRKDNEKLIEAWKDIKRSR